MSTLKSSPIFERKGSSSNQAICRCHVLVFSQGSHWVCLMKSYPRGSASKPSVFRGGALKFPGSLLHDAKRRKNGRGNMLWNIRQRKQYLNNHAFSGRMLKHAYIVFQIFFWKKHFRILGQTKKLYDMETDGPKPLERSISKLIITVFRCHPK